MTEREQVIANLLFMKRDVLEGSDKDQTIDRAIELLTAQCSKWVKITGMEPPEYAGRYTCERCGWRDHPYNKNERHPYCPGCGAYMTNNDGLVGGNA